MQDFKAASEMTDKSNTLGFVFLTSNAKDSRKLRTSEEERITLSSLSLPMNVERHEADLLQVESDSEGRNIRSPANPVLKSRLSVLSSLVSSSNDLMVRLSYYSNEDIHEADSPVQLRSLSGSGLDDEDVSNVTVPISLSIMIMTTYILIGAIVFCIWEDPNYLKWSYFCFVTLSTIGFGDIVPGMSHLTHLC
ncbi:unnamed protein product [Hydatigera taeniaeformis]|uniref:Ion_trans_2 domain-containing protein n=1 Tax=Hydatigena taeniaeformis TaxID=6205 RepID=A0A0R3WXF4_HYDTA|nr:unnamed protein product [Hydatigera taeniaeformis]